MQIIAHRGASVDAPENTLASFREAIRQKADGIELDVMRCATGEVLVCHDENLKRLTKHDLELRLMSLKSLKCLDVLSSERFRHEKIPTLDEVLDLVPQNMYLNVELKCDTVDDFGLTEATCEILANAGHTNIVVSSFNPLCLLRMMQCAPQFRRALLIDNARNFTLQNYFWRPLVEPFAVHPHYDFISRQTMAEWKALDLIVSAWTVDDPEELRRLSALEVDAVITNRPKATRAILKVESV